MQLQTTSSAINSSTDRSFHTRWLAIAHRAPYCHSAFLYGVKSTRIYCRPTCTARLARRANVIFYDTEDQAQRDGYRPCKRCKPDDPNFVVSGEEIVTRVLVLLRTKHNLSMLGGGVKGLAQEVGVTPSYLCRVFKKTMGVTVGAYVRAFETDASEGESEGSVQAPSSSDISAMDIERDFLTPFATVQSPPISIEGPRDELAKNNIGKEEEAFDLGYDFDDWVCSDYFSNDGP